MDPTLCLNMIVKNESRIITRLFDSVISIIDSYCICDTGSTDNTVELIENYFKEKGKPGKIVREPFKNFCHNRNFALQSCIGLSDYVLLLDADMILEIKSFNKSTLREADSFYILQGNDSFYYQNMRIVRNNGLYKYVGVTHEYIDTPGNNIITGFNKDELFIRDVGDGGAKSDKFQRDINLLTDGLKEEPNNGRYYFYLGNSYHDTGKYAEAIDCYKKRIELGGWREEVWYSYYKAGICCKHMGNLGEAIRFWLEGFNFYPDRLEAIYELIKHYRHDSKQKLCMGLYNMIKDILHKNANRNDYLFLHNDVYAYLLYYEYTIFAYYNDVKDISDEFVKVFNEPTSRGEHDNILSNLKFYKQILKANHVYRADNSVAIDINGENTKFNSSSSCLIKKPNSDNYLCNIRYVNYSIIEENGAYVGCDKHIITINKHVEFDKNFNPVKEDWIDLVYDGRLYIGVEDVKIYYDNYSNKLLHIGTGYHADNKIGIVSGEYKKRLEINELKQNFNNTGCEKNWVFVDYNGETNIVYDWHPLRICKLDGNEAIVVAQKNTPSLFSRVRGSTCGFKYNKNISDNNNGNIVINIRETEIWFINHIVSYESPRHYYHIISVFDSNMNLLRYSAPFKFEGDPIEYCLSIVVEDERVIINYSTWDRNTRIGVYDKKYIDTIVKYK